MGTLEAFRSVRGPGFRGGGDSYLMRDSCQGVVAARNCQSGNGMHGRQSRPAAAHAVVEC